jgi:predicted alpha/beta hydrolase
MPISAELDKLLDKEYENTDLQSLTKAPVAAIAGVSDADAEALHRAFGIKTVGDLGHNRYFRAAEAIVSLAEASR